MTRKKNRTKKHNPKAKALVRVARHLVLIHQHSMGYAPNGDPVMTATTGRLRAPSEDVLFHLVKELTATSRRWIFEAFAIFDDGETTYTDTESACTQTSYQFEDVHELALPAMERCKAAGNPKHLTDWGGRICVYTPARYKSIGLLEKEAA